MNLHSVLNHLFLNPFTFKPVTFEYLVDYMKFFTIDILVCYNVLLDFEYFDISFHFDTVLV